MSDTSTPLILLTGATGYVGGRLLKALEQTGHRVRCLARRPQFLQPKVGPTTDVWAGDVLDPPSLSAALEGVHTAYYLIHSMNSTQDFEDTDRRAAEYFATAAKQAGVARIVYLGGLGESHSALSPHLRSRQEVGAILQQSGAQVLEFRSSIVIGSGSLSFELVRALTERIPVMIMPRWVSVATQPIAVEDLVAYLLAAVNLPLGASRIFEIGGADQVCYEDIMRNYARQRRLPRLMLLVPMLTPRLSSLWLGLVTPVYARIGRQLIDSIRHPTVVHDPAARQTFDINPMGIENAIARALGNEDQAFAQTRWSDTLSSGGVQPRWGGVRFGTRIVDSREVLVPVPPDAAFAPIRRIGGETGWYYADWLWRLRGFIDLLVGGVGSRRGRRHAEWLYPGETVDFWRVEIFEQDRQLRLFAEMKLPGRAWLEFEVEGEGEASRIRQTAIFDPVGVWGQLYWYVLYPLHQLIFAGMLRNIAAAAQQGETTPEGPKPIALETR
ncbi:SDR family oxidoreductase [Candidatus Entotheonella palauensis]|uniref:SDR family oxidoreductase n=1 Tax=Candidatus Entotheonella palauensis TaxID=93172 RepID=UPI000B7F184B|nr:SDR family oxidoreductase [Candidatus Entotheonella palauensis]